MDVRASSTTLDVVLFVILIGAAVGILTNANPGGSAADDRVADETADVVATSTAEVTYSRTATVATGGLLGGEAEREVTAERRASGTYAELLASAAVTNPSFPGAALTGTGADVGRAVRAVTRRNLPTGGTNAQVRAVWRPYDDASLGGDVLVGERPPAHVDVSTAAISTPSGFPNVSSEARRVAGSSGYNGVATVVARAVVDGLFPPTETTDALHSEGPDRALVAHRYRTASETLDVDVGETLGRLDVDGTNARLASELAAQLEEDMVGRFDSPAAAARAVRVDRVRIVVRTWSP